MATLTLLADFPDQLSPMVVKELRQGLRTRLFGGVMLVLHALMVIITLMGGATSDTSEVRWLMDAMVTLILCVIFPLCGFSALAGEIKSNTMDMLVLTRLSAGRIVLGKWAAIVVQSLLVTVSLAPYIVARYVYGGSDLLADLSGLASQWLLSAVLTAGVVALSTQKQFWIRALFIAVPLLFLLVGSLGFFYARSLSRVLVTDSSWKMYVSMVAGSAWLIFAFLSFGASRIAPPASQLPAVKRLVNLGALLVFSAGERLLFDTVAVSWLVVLVASVDALTDDLRFVPSVYLPFYRRSWWGRWAARVLAPGWMHGFLYSMMLAAIAMTISLAFRDYINVAKFWVEACGISAAAFFGHMLAIRRTGEYVGAVFAGACILIFLSMMCSLVQSVQDAKAEWMSYLFPLNTMGLFGTSYGLSMGYFHTAIMANAVWPALLSLLAFRAFRQTRRVRQEAERILLS